MCSGISTTRDFRKQFFVTYAKTYLLNGMTGNAMTLSHGFMAIRRDQNVADSFWRNLGHYIVSTVAPGQRALAYLMAAVLVSARMVTVIGCKRGWYTISVKDLVRALATGLEIPSPRFTRLSPSIQDRHGFHSLRFIGCGLLCG